MPEAMHCPSGRLRIPLSVSDARRNHDREIEDAIRTGTSKATITSVAGYASAERFHNQIRRDRRMAVDDLSGVGHGSTPTRPRRRPPAGGCPGSLDRRCSPRRRGRLVTTMIGRS